MKPLQRGMESEHPQLFWLMPASTVMKSAWFLVALLGASGLCLLAQGNRAPSRRNPAPAPLLSADRSPRLETYGKLPLSFEANHGQADPRAMFLARGPDYTVFLRAAETVLTLRTPQQEPHPGFSARTPAGADLISPLRETSPLETAILRTRLVGANPKATLQ